MGNTIGSTMTKIPTVIFLSVFSATHEVYGFQAPLSLPTHRDLTLSSRVFRAQQPYLQYPSVQKAKSTFSSSKVLFSTTLERIEEDEEKEEALLSNKLGLAGTIAILYTNYLKRLWRETAPKERRRIASQRASNAINNVKHLMEGEEFV